MAEDEHFWASWYQTMADDLHFGTCLLFIKQWQMTYILELVWYKAMADDLHHRTCLA